MTKRFGVISKNVVLTDEIVPIHALILIDGEVISEIIRLTQGNEDYEEVKK